MQNANEVNAGESDFHELTDGFYDWANLTYESNQAKKADEKKEFENSKDVCNSKQKREAR